MLVAFVTVTLPPLDQAPPVPSNLPCCWYQFAVGDVNKNSWFGVEIFHSEYLCREGSPYPNGTSHLELEECGVMEMPPVIWSDLGDCFPR